MKKIQIATVFSGIGAPEQALNKMNIPYNIVFGCDNGEIELSISQDDIDTNIKELSSSQRKAYIDELYKKTNKINHVKTSYFANYDISEDNWYNDIRFLDGNEYKGKVDIFVGGSPCQSFSISGKRKGLEDTRGTLFYEFARLVQEIKPQVFIYENVPGMITHDNGKTWEIIKSVFDSLGYTIKHSILNSSDYGIPQNRRRLFVVGFRKKSEGKKFKFPEPVKLETTASDYYEKNNLIDAKHYLGKKGFEFVTNPKYKGRARINRDIIATQKANQQFNWNGDFVFVDKDEIKNNKQIKDRAFIGKYEGKIGAIRQLTYRECLRLMGFDDSFKIVVPNVPMYRQVGNSIVVNVLESIYNEIFKVVNFNE